MIPQIGRKYPFLTGCGRIANSTIVKRVFDRSFDDEVSGTLRNGMRFIGPARDFVSRAAYLFGDLDPKITHLCSEIVREGDTVVDIGANFGLFSLYASSAVGKTGAVHAVEPQPSLVRQLKKSLALNDISNVSVHEVALGDNDQRGILNIPSGNRGAASLIPKNGVCRCIMVDVFASGAFLEDHGITDVRLIKIDVEGFEDLVIEGAVGYLNRFRPDAIIFEAKYERSRIKNRGVSILEDIGYRCMSIRPSLFSLRLGAQGKTGECSGVHDILAVAPGIAGNEILDHLP